jgi:carbamoyltransferase
MKIIGICSGHDCSYAVLENGIPVIHNELERFIRQKEPIDDAVKFLFDTYDDVDDIKHACTFLSNWKGGISQRYPESYQKMESIVSKNGGQWWSPGHHQSHAANAFFSSNFDESLIITIDGGGEDIDMKNNCTVNTFTAWSGINNHVWPLEFISDSDLNLGVFWNRYTKDVFGLSGTGPPYGSQAGTVMGMAALGDPNKFKNDLMNKEKLRQHASESEQNRFDIAASMQQYTEEIIKEKISKHLNSGRYKNLCLSGGVALNCVMVGKILKWFPDINIYVDPVPYDGGLALGSARYIWHHELGNPRIKWEDNATPYLGYKYHKDAITEQLEINKDKLIHKKVTDEDVVNLLNEQNIISIFNEGSESGRRALGNRSIIADPRSDKMKDIINEKVKHRQWFRPFAPSILREEVGKWFMYDVDSPYMNLVMPFREEMKNKVPAVVHFDGTARLQTVTKNDNNWYYNFIKKWFEVSGVPIVLNTSFNDREPIVETPEHAINCFLGTNIDYLYFPEYGILCNKREK